MRKYIYNYHDWPDFVWDHQLVLSSLGEVRNLQGRLLGKMEGLGFHLQNEAVWDTISLDVLKSNEIEGKSLDMEEVRSSIANKLGLDFKTDKRISRDVDGVVEMMMDASQNYTQQLTSKRLFNWHAALFPTGRTGLQEITVGNWRQNDKGPMQVVSGPMGRERVHFQAPDSDQLTGEMKTFLNWFNSKSNLDDVIKAAISHLWFITLHPFDDGNGRMARAITDMQLARSDKSSQRFYSMSAQIMKERKKYYSTLEKVQKSDLDITVWILWFLECLKKAVITANKDLSTIMSKAKFWENHQKTIFNKRQVKMLNRLFENFEGKLSSSKWAKMTKCSTDTALRDIQDLERKHVLLKEDRGGRSTTYRLKL